jgi:hypothetical protein
MLTAHIGNSSQDAAGARLDAFDLVEDHLRSSTNPQVLGQIHAANQPTAVHKKFSRPRDVFAVFSGARM